MKTENSSKKYLLAALGIVLQLHSYCLPNAESHREEQFTRYSKLEQYPLKFVQVLNMYREILLLYTVLGQQNKEYCQLYESKIQSCDELVELLINHYEKNDCIGTILFRKLSKESKQLHYDFLTKLHTLSKKTNKEYNTLHRTFGLSQGLKMIRDFTKIIAGIAACAIIYQMVKTLFVGKEESAVKGIEQRLRKAKNKVRGFKKGFEDRKTILSGISNLFSKKKTKMVKKEVTIIKREQKDLVKRQRTLKQNTQMLQYSIQDLLSNTNNCRNNLIKQNYTNIIEHELRKYEAIIDTAQKMYTNNNNTIKNLYPKLKECWDVADKKLRGTEKNDPFGTLVTSCKKSLDTLLHYKKRTPSDKKNAKQLDSGTIENLIEALKNNKRDTVIIISLENNNIFLPITGFFVDDFTTITAYENKQ